MESIILNLLIVLFLAWISGTIATKLGYPSILGELIAGIIFGPALLGLLETSEALNVLADLGVLLMMLYIGMEIDYKELKKASWPGLLAAIGGFITPFALGYYSTLAFGYSQAAALFVAIAVGVTSLATKSRILVDLKLLDTRIAHVLMAGALLSDTIALLIFAVIIAVAENGFFEVSDLAVVGVRAILFFAATILLGLFALPFIGRLIHKSKFNSRTLNFTFMLLSALLFAEFAEFAGLHGILGAFIAGLFLKDSIPDRRLYKSFNDTIFDVSIGFLAPIFFITAGFHVTLDVFTMNLPLLITVIVVATVGKIAGTMLFYLPSGHGWREGFAIGGGMNGRGAVEIIIAGIGLQMGVISNEIFSVLVFMAIFTTATVPFLLKWSVDWLRKRGELVRSGGDRNGTLIIGASPISRFIARKLSERQPVWLIDSNSEHCRQARRDGLNAIQGNALKEETLSEARAAKARTFISLTLNSEINILAAQLAKEQFLIPNVHVLLTQSAEAARVSLLQPIRASSVFAKKVEIAEWERIIEKGNYEIITTTIAEPKKPKRFFAELLISKGSVLPLIIYSGKEASIFHYEAELEPGDEVLYLYTEESFEPPAA